MVRTVPTVNNVDQSLEDICKQQLESKRGAKKGASQKRASPQKQRNDRRGSVGKARGGSRYGRGGDVSVAENGAQRTNLFSGRSKSEGRERDNQRTKMMVSNLDYKVSQRDMEELFSEFQDFSKAVLHFDQNARSLGTCELTFRSRTGAMKAHKQYNGVPLDGKSMRIEVLGEVQMAPVSSRLGQKSPERRQRDRSPFRRARGGRGGRGPKPAGKPQREKREKKETPSAEDLDKELDTYLAAGASN